MTITLTEQSPVEIDTMLYELYVKASKVDTQIENAWTRIHQTAGDKRQYSGRVWAMTDAEARFKAVELAANVNAMAWTREAAQSALEALEAAHVAQAVVKAEADPLNAEFDRRGGWTRSFLVTNGDGHAHRSMNCSTCNRGRYATSFAWMTEWSGKDEAEIVEAAGWRACTVCYPSAPVGDETSLPTKMFSEEDKSKAAAKAEREAAKAAREAKAKANAPTKSGEPLRVETGSYWETFKTERAAMMWATDQVKNSIWYPNSHNERGGIKVVAEAVAEKRGVSVEDVLAEIQTKGEKKAST